VYGPGDGIEIGGPWFVTNHKTRDGQMWFGGPKGVTAFYPEQIRNNEFRPPVYITSITQGGEEVVTGKALERVARIDISWKRPFFEFKAAALNYSRPEHNRYKYMLEGWDTEWFYAGDFRNGRYSNLKGGQYTLRVAGSNNDGIWCSREQEAVLTIVVSNPFWRTGWFSFLLAAGVVLMTGCVIFYLLRLRSEINARKEQENALKESERKYRDLIDKAPDIRYRTDIEGRIVFVSDSIHRISGYSQEEAMGMRMAEELYANPADRDEFLSMLQEKEHVENFEAQLRKKDGSIWWGSTNAHFSRDNDGTVLAVEGVTRDVTERKSLQDRLQQAQKMEAIGTLAGGIAHDFNNILGIILGYAEMAKEDAVPGTNQERDLENVLAGADRAKSLVQQILAFSRQSQVEPIQIKIQPLIKEGLKMLRSSIPATISITEDIAPDSGIILADPTQVHQILMNLGTNAYHAMEGSGGVLSVTLKSTFIGPDEKELLLHVNSGDYVEFTVSDTGAGMGPDVIEKIFDPYFTTKEIGKGTGMGLAIIHGIVKDYGGTITVESQIGKGTTFHVYFPVVEEGTSPDKKEPKDIPIGTERILFVDDEQLLAEMGKVMLERLGYHVTVRRSSLEALETFQNTPNAFDLVITDQTMHGMTGYDLARRMMQIKPDIPIILCTGYSSLIDEESAKNIGIKEFALKPLTKEVIARLIRKVLGEVV
jgi:PAS domain S-box-containing protein